MRRCQLLFAVFVYGTSTGLESRFEQWIARALLSGDQELGNGCNERDEQPQFDSRVSRMRRSADRRVRFIRVRQTRTMDHQEFLMEKNRRMVRCIKSSRAQQHFYTRQPKLTSDLQGSGRVEHSTTPKSIIVFCATMPDSRSDGDSAHTNRHIYRFHGGPLGSPLLHQLSIPTSSDSAHSITRRSTHHYRYQPRIARCFGIHGLPSGGR